MSPPSCSPARAASPAARRSSSRKLKKKRHDSNIDIPERLRDSDEESADEESSSQGPPLFMNMNQSIFGLIAAAGSRIDFNDRFAENSSDEEGEGNDEAVSGGKAKREDLAQTTVLQSGKGRKKDRHSRKFSGHKLLKSLPTLPRLKAKSKSAPSKLATATEEDEDDEPSSTSDVSAPPAIKLTKEMTRESTNRLAPVMSRMLEARAEVAGRPSFDLDGSDARQSSLASDVTPLEKRLMEIFEFDEPEHVINEYPCWLLQSVLLQGFLYITAKHICFYAYLPKKANMVAKSGFLSKSGKRNPKYNRYWFRLKGDVLSYYRDSTNLYFPHGQIDLSYGISASITDKEKEAVSFEVVTRHRTYNFRADSAPSAKEWVKSLQRVIFRSHNEGDSVKISLPIANVMDVEETHMMEFAETCKIRVIDNDETYAIDEYFFSFFSFGTEAIDILKLLVEDNGNNEESEEKSLPASPIHPPGVSSRQSSPGPRNSLQVGKSRGGRLPDQVKATLSPMSPHSPVATSPRASMDTSRRSSFDAFRQFGRKSVDIAGNVREESPRRSFSASRRSTSFARRDGNKTPQRRESQHASSESYVQSSIEEPSFSNIAASSVEDPSASQILQNSEVFRHSPTVPHSSVSHSGELQNKAKSAREKLPPLATYSGQYASQGTGYDSMMDSQNQQSTPTLQNITKMGQYPLQRASAFADYLNRTQQRMRTLLASESMGYVEKVSGMWKGERKHYDEPEGLRPDDDDLEPDSEGKLQTSMNRFRAHFALPESEKLQATYFGYIFRVLPLYGKIYISDRSFCFRSLLPGTRTKLILPLQDIETVHKEKGFRLGYSGLVVVIKGHEELFFEFGQGGDRDDCTVTLLRSLEATRYLKESGMLNRDEEAEEDNALAERDALKSARQDERPDHELSMPRRTTISDAPPILDETDGSFLNFKPRNPLNITCLTIGSRGDVQPYIALCKGLLAEGHKPKIATHAEFQGWIESHGIEFARVEGDPAELMRLCIEHGTFTWAFLREANSSFRGWLDGLLVSAAEACEGSDLLIESPSAMAGIHIAEKLGIPYFRAFTMPWTRTRAYPHAFIMPEHKMGGAYNYMTYVMFDNIFWKAIAHQVNKWRNNTLGLPNTSLEKMQPNKVPFLYNFSPSVVAPPLDFSDWIRVTGYWFLDEGSKYEPPADLEAFIQKARDDEKKIVYVGFGSIIVDDPPKMTREVIDAVLKADVRCVLSKGWSERISSQEEQDPSKPRPDEPEMPPEIFVIKSAPHDWLFSRVDAAAHHGGSGTTGASLRAGIPTIIRPFFGDQYFFASRVEDLGVGIHLKRWGINAFGRALWEATRNERMIVKAKVLGEEIRSENGVDLAIQSIYRDLEYSKSLIKRKAGKNADNEAQDDMDEEDEESWTFVGADEPDPDFITKKLSEGLAGGTLAGRSMGDEVGGSKALGSQVLKAA